MDTKTLRLKNKLTVSIAAYLILSFLFIIITSKKGGMIEGILLTIYPVSMPLLALFGYTTSNEVLDLIINVFSLIIVLSVSICVYRSVRYTNPSKDAKYEIIGILLLVPWFFGAFTLLLLAHVH